LRLFVALNLPENVRTAVCTTVRPLQNMGFALRWMKPEHVHLTLKFLGEVDLDREPELVATLGRACAGARPVTLSLRDFGVFPHYQLPSVVWVGVAPEPALELLQHRVEQEFAPLDFPKVVEGSINAGRRLVVGRWDHILGRTSYNLAFGRLTLHTVAKRAQIDGEDIELTPREWGVLEYLLTRTDQVISKEQMLQALCSWDDSLTHNAIEVYISRLRSKLQKAGIKIRTVRGFGYMVEDPDASTR